MNTKIVTIVAAALLCEIVTSTYAQDKKAGKASNVSKASNVYYATAKPRYLDNLHDMEDMSTTNLKTATNVNPQILNAFLTAFKNATDHKWFFYDRRGKNFLVKFLSDQRDYKALLN